MRTAARDADLGDLRSHLASRVAERRDEIEATMQVRIAAVADPSQVRDPMYVEGLRAALAASLDYALATLERDGDGGVEVPATLLAQARLAARSRVGLDTVLRRYFAGYTLLSDLLVQEAEGLAASGVAMQQLLRTQAAGFDRLIASITEEHSREWGRRPDSSDGRQAKLVQSLLDGELVDGDQLDYDFEFQHLGLIAVGPGGGEAIRDLALEFDHRWLLVHVDETTVWVWIGTGRKSSLAHLGDLIAERWPRGLLLGMGEPLAGISGWRLTHRQAAASLAIAMPNGQGVVRYADAALLASTLADETFSASLRRLFLEPLGSGRNGAILRETLRAYFAAERHTSSTAAALGVSRQTVINRLRKVDACLARPLSRCEAEMEAALRLEEFDRAPERSTIEAASAKSLRLVRTDPCFREPA